ncbi:serine hydrolase [Salinifilum ghardaiensis]
MTFAEALVRRAPWREFPGNLALAAWHLHEREPVLVDAHRAVHAASTIKVLPLIAALRAVERGELDLAADMPVPTARVGGSGVLKDLRCRRLPLDDLLTLMIAISDNTAANAVLDLVGFTAVDELARELGCTGTRVQRHLMATDEPGVLETTALDQARVLDRVATGAALGPEASRHALRTLSRQHVRDRLPAELPECARSWNKTGEIAGHRHDVALLGREEPECVVAVLTDRLEDERAACAHIAGIGSAAFAALPQRPPPAAVGNAVAESAAAAGDAEAAGAGTAEPGGPAEPGGTAQPVRRS